MNCSSPKMQPEDKVIKLNSMHGYHIVNVLCIAGGKQIVL